VGSEPTRPAAGRSAQEPLAWDEDDDADPDRGDAEERAALAARRAGPGQRGRDRALAREAGPERRPAISPGRPAGEADAPPWERPRRLEAYPTLRRRRLPSLPLGGSPVLLGIVAVAIAAIALFFLPALLGIGNPSGPATSAGPTAAPSAGSTTSAAPTIVVAPTQQIYIVQSGDLMSTIAARFGVPLQALVDANKVAIPNPDKIKPGDQVIIPAVAPTTIPGSSGMTSAPTPS
jgi:LysM repeat protein